jgi:hypothetical protein
MLEKLGETSHVLLGFMLCCVILSIVITLDWRHYIRYYVGRHSEYGKRREGVFRLFWLLCLISSGYGLINNIFDLRPGISDAVFSLLDGLILTGIFFAVDGVFRLTMGRPQ